MSLTKKIAQQYLVACSDHAAQEKLYRLYALLDDIDTADDMAKDNDTLYRNLVRRYHNQRHEVVPDTDADALYAEFHGRTAGWWSINPDTGGILYPPQAEDAGYMGDGPADTLGLAIDNIVRQYLDEWERPPTMVELDAAWRFVSGPYRSGDLPLVRTAAANVLTPTGKGDSYHADLAKDAFIHFTPADRAKQIVASGKLLMNPPFKKFGPDAVYAVSVKWGSFRPRVQTTHYGNVPLVGILFTTTTMPKIGYTEEVVWDRDVVMHNPKVLPYNQAVSLINAARDSVSGEAYVLYGKDKMAKYKDKKQVKTKDGDTVTVYEYSERQVANRHREKAERLDNLQSNIGKLEDKVHEDLGSDDDRTRMTALAVALINDTYERVGNDESAANGHYGVTGWLKKHISFNNGEAKISYVGKSGVKQTKTVSDSALVKALKDAAEGKGGDDPLFDCEGCSVSSKEVNAYLKPFDITAKDLRGYHANREMMEALADIRSDGPSLPRDRKAKDKILKGEFARALDVVAKIVGHETATLRNQYLVPHLEETYMKDGSVIQSLKKESRLRRASLGLERYVRATKTRAEKEDEQVKDKLVRRSPKIKPPRQDLRDHRIDTDEDPDLKSQGQEGDRDLSLNYKRVANLYCAANQMQTEAVSAYVVAEAQVSGGVRK